MIKDFHDKKSLNFLFFKKTFYYNYLKKKKIT